MDSELKPCPFCGADAKIYKIPLVGHKRDRKTGAILPALAAICTNMDCAANMGNYYDRDDIVEAWNRRVVT